MLKSVFICMVNIVYLFLWDKVFCPKEGNLSGNEIKL